MKVEIQTRLYGLNHRLNLVSQIIAIMKLELKLLYNIDSMIKKYERYVSISARNSLLRVDVSIIIDMNEEWPLKKIYRLGHIRFVQYLFKITTIHVKYSNDTQFSFF